MFGPELADSAVLRRIARRVEDILESARERERKGQSLALDIDARFRLEEVGAVQFQLASAILEEAGGLGQDEVVGELLSLGLASVLNGAARAAGMRAELGDLSDDMDEDEDEELLGARKLDLESFPGVRGAFPGRVLN